MTYEQLMKAHLSNYKVKKLAVTRPKKWRGGEMDYHYILPANRRELNFLSPYRTETGKFIEAESIKLHPSFHYLNSSQAVCVNFFYPFIAEGQWPLLLKVLGMEGEEVESFQFEKMMGEGEQTTFDFYLKLKSDKDIFFEVKYTENSFGHAPDEGQYEKQYQKIHQKILAGEIQPSAEEYTALLKNHQMLQQIAYGKPDGNRIVVFICPENNKSLQLEYRQVMDHVVVPELQGSIRMVTWENLLKDLKIHLKSNLQVPGKLVHHYREFEDKYFPI